MFQAAALGALFEDKPQSANDAWRKLHSDPLLLIRQREQDAIARIKNNPIKMAEIKKSVSSIFLSVNVELWLLCSLQITTYWIVSKHFHLNTPSDTILLLCRWKLRKSKRKKRKRRESIRSIAIKSQRVRGITQMKIQIQRK